MIVDAHEDIAWNVLTFGRDYMRGNQAIRDQESSTDIPRQNGNTLLGYDAWQDGEIAVIFATLFESPARKSLGTWDSQVYTDQQQAHAIASKQVDIYRQMIEQHSFQLIETQSDLNLCLKTWEPESPTDNRQIGLVLLMEGADPIEEPQQVADWQARGVRIVGPAWESTRYAGGTHEAGPLTSDGERLLTAMQELGMILDLSHLAEEAYYQALDLYEGVMIASHSNPRRFLPTSRGLSDEMIRLLAERGGVVGVVLFNKFLKASWKRHDPKQQVTLSDVVDVIDHVCQLTGSVDHVALGSDFDGGFGLEHVPAEVNTVADLARLQGILAGRGYQPDETARILSGNWLRILQQGLPS
jgi:membrane dipeptidase